MGLRQFIDISRQIATIFELEDVERYYKKQNGRNSGILYTQYYNRLAATKKKRRRESTPEQQVDDVQDDSITLNGEIEAAIEWMVKNDPVAADDEEEEGCLIENWRYCFRYRTRTIISHDGDVNEIVKIWPALKQTYGITLINLDFEEMFGIDEHHFKRKWTKFAKENLTTLRSMHVCPTVQKDLSNLINGVPDNVDGDNYNIKIFFALLHLMEPQTAFLKNKKRYKPTIPSSKERLLNYVIDSSQVDAMMGIVKKDREIKQLNLYPLIFGIGTSISAIQEFRLQYNDISYPCDTFVSALDAAFKTHIFFKIPFSPEHKRFWALINGLFYKIESPLLDVTAAIASCISSFKM